MRQPRVLLDVDGVLADFASAYLDVINAVTGHPYKIEQVTRFDMTAELGLSNEEAAACKRALSDVPRFARAIRPYVDAFEGVKKLQAVSDLYIVTSPWNSHPTWVHDREHWLKANFDIPASRVVHTSAKHLVKGDFLIDDRSDTLRMWSEEFTDGQAVLWETPHNVGEDWGGLRTKDWRQLVEFVGAWS